MAYDVARDRVLVMEEEPLNSVKEFSFADGVSLDLGVEPPTAGAIARSPDAACYAPDGSVMITATPTSSGYVFAGWRGDASGNDNPLKLTMDHYRAVVATFEVSTATLLSRFDAEPVLDGIRLQWRMSEASHVSRTTVQRSERAQGPWTEASVEYSTQSGNPAALDRGVTPGTTYWYRLEAQFDDGSRQVFDPISVIAGVHPPRTELSRIVPNPSSNGAVIDYAVARETRVRLEVFDLNGRIVSTLANAVRKPGRYSVTWAPSRSVPAGLYFVRLDAAGTRSFERLIRTP
jgi:uncharacterized repeat protein (TIGR02543 family)